MFAVRAIGAGGALAGPIKRVRSMRIFPYGVASAPFSTSPKPLGQDRVKPLSFEVFVKENMENYATFSSNPVMQKICRTEKNLEQTYQDLCNSSYNQYLQSLKRGNPTLAV